jgi:hypothetical protein
VKLWHGVRVFPGAAARNCLLYLAA